MRLIKLLIFSLLCFDAMAKVKLNDISFTKVNSKLGKLTIKLNENFSETPELTIKDKLIQVALPNSVVWPKINKQLSVGKRKFDTTLMAYQFDNENVRVRTILPYSIKGKENLISLVMKGNEIELHFPIIDSKKAKHAAHAKKKNKKQYDESFLEKLVREKDESKSKTIGKKELPAVQKILTKVSESKKDEVSVAMSATKKEEGFSISSYIGKFVSFLALVILFFYIVMNVFRKGLLKKNKLGFLNNNDIIEVLSTNYVSPKKSLLLVKVHNQILLLSSTEKGLDFLTEVNDLAGLMKDGEKSILGNNFDSSINTANTENKDFKIKDIVESNVEASHSTEDVKDSVKLSQQIKNKVKSLKSLQ